MKIQDIKDIQKILEEHEERIKGLEREKAPEKTNLENQKKISIKEFLIEKNPSNDVKKAACVSYYLEKYEGVKVLTAKNITEGFRKAKVKIPKNIPDKIQKAISNGWIAQESKKGEYYLTTTGEEIVKNSFNKNGK